MCTLGTWSKTFAYIRSFAASPNEVQFSDAQWVMPASQSVDRAQAAKRTSKQTLAGIARSHIHTWRTGRF